MAFDGPSTHDESDALARNAFDSEPSSPSLNLESSPQPFIPYESPRLVNNALGPFGLVPRDSRIGLANDLHRLSQHPRPIPLEKQIEMLQEFDRDRAVQNVSDFCIMDSDPSQPDYGHAVYRLKEDQGHDDWFGFRCSLS